MNNECIHRLAIAILTVLLPFLLWGCGAPKKIIPPEQDHAEISRPASEKTAPSIADMPAEQVEEQAPDTGRQADDAEAENREGAAGEKTGQDLLLPVLTLVDERIVAYENKIAAWEGIASQVDTFGMDEVLKQELQGCRRILQDNLAAYNRLHDELISEGAGQVVGTRVMEDLQEVQRRDIVLLETGCQQIIASSGRNILTGSRAKILKKLEQEIGQSFSSGDYQQTVRLYEQVPPNDAEQLSAAAGLFYGQALLKIGREKEAVDILKQLLQRMQQQSKLEQEFALMRLIADINFGMNQYDSAFEDYRNIINRYAALGDNIDWARKQQSVIGARERKSEEVRDYAELMHDYLAYIPERDAYDVVIQAERFIAGYPDSPVLPTVNRILFESRDRAEAWFVSMLAQLEKLQQEKEYEEALQLLDTLPLQQIPLEKRENLRRLADELISAQFQQNEMQRLAREDALQESWAKGQQYLQAKEYDQAIAVLNTLLGTSYEEKARQSMDEIVQIAAREKRRKAAELFVRAGNSQDLKMKIKLLFESRDLLQEILAKYGRSDLVEKVRNNLARIDEELNRIDPALLSAPDADNADGETEMEPVAPAGSTQLNLQELLVRPGGSSSAGTAR